MSDSNFPYIHGFSKTEQDRLRHQAKFAEHTIYKDIDFSRVETVLEVGSGVGAQSEILLRRFPQLNLTCVDLSPHQIQSAEQLLSQEAHFQDRYKIHQMNADNLSFKSSTFEGAFVCWLLEHVNNPQKVLSEIRRVVRPGGIVYITEVLNSSFHLDPYSPNVWKYWMAFNDYQLEQKGDPFVGAKLGNLLLGLGFENIQVETKTWHLDNRFPDQRKETIDFWASLLMSASDQLIADNVVDKQTVEKAKQELATVANDPNAVFYYSFIQSKARV